jgi:multiple sugar transport system permease protein
MTSTDKRNLRNGLLFASPWIVGFCIFTIYPIIMSIYYSFCRFDAITQPHWAGLENYQTLLTKDPLFWKSLWITFYMVIFGLPSALLFSLFLAILLNQKIKGQAFYRTIFYLPSITPVVASSILWMWLLNPQVGLINYVLHPILNGINTITHLSLATPGWLADPVWSKPALVLMGLWGVGNTVIIFLAALQEVPEELYEAALIDGAGAWRKLFHITLPLISPVIFFNLVMGIIGYFQYFTQVWVMTRGGPSDSTTFYALYLFNNAFLFFKMGYASAMAWILFAITLVCTLIVFRTSSKWVYYSGETK